MASLTRYSKGFKVRYRCYWPDGTDRIAWRYRTSRAEAEWLCQRAEQLEAATRELLLTPAQGMVFVHAGLLSLDELSAWMVQREALASRRLPVPEAGEVPPHGYVYLLQCGPYYRIGRTWELKERLRALSVELPHKPVLLHAIPTATPEALERVWHRRLAAKRLNGEWFALTAADIEAFCRFEV